MAFAGFQTAPGPDCCCGTDECTLYLDLFDADSISGGSWSASAGSWSITGGKASTTSANAVLLWSDSFPDSYQHILATFTISADATKVRLIVDRVDASNYCYAELNLEATTVTLRVVRVVSGTHTTMASDSLSESGTIGFAGSSSRLHTLAVCRTPTGLSANATFEGTLSGSPWPFSFRAGASHTALGGLGAAIGTGTNGGTVAFEDVTISRHRSGPDYTECPYCVGKCVPCDPEHPLPTSFLVDLSPGGLTDGICDCSGFDGVTVVDAIPATSTNCGGTWSEGRRWPWNCDPQTSAGPGSVWPAWSAFFRKGKNEAGGTAFIFVTCALKFITDGIYLEVTLGGNQGSVAPDCTDGSKTMATYRSAKLSELGDNNILCDSIFPVTLSKVSESYVLNLTGPTRSYTLCNGSMPSTITVDT